MSAVGPVPERPAGRAAGGVVGRAPLVVGRRLPDVGSLRAGAGSPDWFLVGAVLALTFVGLVFMYSSSFAISLESYGETEYFAKRQLIGAGLGAIAFVACSLIDYRVWRRLSPLIILGAVILLVAVLLPGIGYSQSGARRWIQIGGLPAIQPSEFAKLAIVIYVAAWLASKGDDIKRIPLGLLPFVMIIGFVGFLLMAEPDLGTFVAIASIGVVMFFLAGASLRHMLVLAGGGVAVLLGIVFVVGYGMERIRTFLNAEDMPQEGGYQILNLVHTLGSGGLTGVGIGASRQKFFYVPSAHTDGVFAIIGEETGILGAMIVLGLFALLVWRGIRAAMHSSDRFGMLLAFGIVSWIGLQTFFNVAGITRTIVLTGIPLPFISFGSSALIATLAAAGVLVSISRHARADDPAAAPPDAEAATRDYAPRVPLDSPFDRPKEGQR